jgi:hypothetical protein
MAILCALDSMPTPLRFIGSSRTATDGLVTRSALKSGPPFGVAWQQPCTAASKPSLKGYGDANLSTEACWQFVRCHAWQAAALFKSLAGKFNLQVASVVIVAPDHPYAGSGAVL